MSYEIAKVSLQGDRRCNQDRCGAVETAEGVLLVVADGMGGHPRGEMAAEIVVTTCSRHFLKAPRPIDKPHLFLSEILRHTHRQVTGFGKRQHPPIDPRTTGVVALLQSDAAFWAHVGDSRLYLFRQGEVISQTEDHSYVQVLRRQGLLSSEEMESHPYRHFVTRCIGGGSRPPEITVGGFDQMEPGDVILLCSDGFWAGLDLPHAGPLFLNGAPLADTINDLADQAARLNAPNSDNVTAVGIRWRDGGSIGEASATQTTGDIGT